MTLAASKFKHIGHPLLCSLTTMVVITSPATASTSQLLSSTRHNNVELHQLQNREQPQLFVDPQIPVSDQKAIAKQPQAQTEQSDLDANSANADPPKGDGETRTEKSSSPQPQETAPPATVPDESSISSEDQARRQLMIDADQLYQSGQRSEAETLYRQAKPPFAEHSATKPTAEPIQDPALLSPGGRVYWREAQAGLQLKLKTRIFVPLRLLVKKHPEFIPGHLQLAAALVADQKPKQALAVMERAASFYPNQPDLQKGLMQQQAQSKKWLEASITARQFALLNPEHPDTPEFLRLSDEYQARFRSRLRTQITNNTIGSFITGALGIAITGSPIPGFSAVQTSILLLRGESAVGNAIASRAKDQLPLIEDPKVQAYVDGIAQKLTTLTGREFDYQFYVVNDAKLNAFALPGGKIFLNGGAILKSNSEAELAGLIAHELSHAVLSHGFQIATEGSEVGGLTRLIPYVGGLVTSLVVADYSREMERQADILGTRLLASANYAADGLRNLMVTLGKEDKPFVAPWFSSHPGSQERVRYLETLIIENGYNRYAYEGIAEHQRIQDLVRSQLKKDEDQEGTSETAPDNPNSDTKNDTDDPKSGSPSIPPVEKDSPIEAPLPNTDENVPNPEENPPNSSIEDQKAPDTALPKSPPTTAPSAPTQ